MASEVDIANLALGHLGDDATVAGFSPPEGSAQAEHCARFYPVARDTLLEMHDWAFATRKANLARLTNNWGQWQYAYALPADYLRAISVIYPDAPDDQSVHGLGTPQPFTVELNDSGVKVLLTNLEDAALRYVARVQDTTQFTPLFITTLAWKLAAFLAGPVIKGAEGAQEAKRCESIAAEWLALAMSKDSKTQHVEVARTPAWIAGR